jgi:hypothetical protein
MPANFDPLVTEVTELTTVAESAVALMDGFSQRLDDAIAADNLSDNSNVARFAADVNAQKTKLADAVARNTVAATEPPAEGGGTV